MTLERLAQLMRMAKDARSVIDANIYQDLAKHVDKATQDYLDSTADQTKEP